MAPFKSDMAAFKPTPTQVVAAVRTLYKDRIRPFGRILLRRLGEIAAAAAADAGGRPADPEAVPYIDSKRLRRLCMACRALRVEPEDAGEYSVLVDGLPAAFVDSSDPRDPFPAGLWSAAEAYFRGLGGSEMLLPAGRYACARELSARGLPFLAGYSLGEVCHVVQLAITQRLLGYHGVHLVPYQHSEACIKDHCAALQQPLCTAKQAPMRTATWHEALTCLQEILASGAGAALPMSNVKRRFRSDYHLDLNETQLGYTRLLDLLRAPAFQGMCRVEPNGHGYVVVPHAGCGPPQACAGDVLPWGACCAPSCMGPASPGGFAPPHGAVSAPPPSAMALPSQVFLVPMQGAWVQAGVPPGAGADLCGGGLPASTAGGSPGHPSSSGASENSERLPAGASTSSPASHGARPSSPSLVSTADGSPDHSSASDDESESSEWYLDGASAGSPVSRGGRPRLDAEGECALIGGPATPAPASLRDAVESSLCSHLEARDGSCCVRNTFIDIATPDRRTGPRGRAQSVPKDLGSSRAAWAAVRGALVAAALP